MKVRHNLIDFQQWATFGKNVGLFHTIVGMNCVAAIELRFLCVASAAHFLFFEVKNEAF